MTTYELQHKDKTWLHRNHNIRIKHDYMNDNIMNDKHKDKKWLHRNHNIRIKHDYIGITT